MRCQAAIARVAAGDTFQLDEVAYRSCACRIADGGADVMACRVPLSCDGPVALGFRILDAGELARRLEDGSISFAKPTSAAQASAPLTDLHAST